MKQNNTSLLVLLLNLFYASSANIVARVFYLLKFPCKKGLMYLFEAVESELLRNNLREIDQWLSDSNLGIYPVASPTPPQKKTN